MPNTYSAVIAAITTGFRALGMQITVTGDEQVPRSGPAVLAANHSSFLDFAFMGLAARASARHVRFLVRRDVRDHRLTGPAMRSMRHIAVDRAAPAGALFEAAAALRAGEVVGVFPEAGVSRSFTIRPLMPGAVHLAQQARAPLFPMAIWGPQQLYTAGHKPTFRRGQSVRLLIGEPLHPQPAVPVADQTGELGRRLGELLERAQRDHPDQPTPGEHAWWHPAHLGGAAPTAQQARALEHPMPPGAVAPLFGAF